MIRYGTCVVGQMHNHRSSSVKQKVAGTCEQIMN